MRSRISKGLLFFAYLLVVAYFAFRPFQRVPGACHPSARMKWDAERGRGELGTALEDKKSSSRLWKALVSSGRMSLEILLQPDSLEQGGPARIVSFSRDLMRRNFTLGQEGNGLAFRLRTTETDLNGVYPSLLVPKVFNDRKPQHLAVTYDGAKVRLYIDGKLHPLGVELAGSFENWGRGYLLTVGDEVPGGRPWSGRIEQFSIYDRALGSGEVESLCRGISVPSAVYVFRGLETKGHGMHPLKYRNLFVFFDTEFNARDCVANIVGFVPLAPLLWLAFPGWFRKKVLAFVVPVVVGLFISATIEFVQRGICGRVPSLLDLVYNVLGVAVGSGLLWLGLKKQENMK